MLPSDSELTLETLSDYLDTPKSRVSSTVMFPNSRTKHPGSAPTTWTCAQALDTLQRSSVERTTAASPAPDVAPDIHVDVESGHVCHNRRGPRNLPGHLDVIQCNTYICSKSVNGRLTWLTAGLLATLFGISYTPGTRRLVFVVVDVRLKRPR